MQLAACSVERHGKTYMEWWFVTENGVVKATSNSQHGLFFILQSDAAEVTQLLTKNGIEHSYNSLALKTFVHQEVGGMYFDRTNSLYKAKTLLKELRISCFDDDVCLTERYLWSALFMAALRAEDGLKLFATPCDRCLFG